MGHAVYRKQHPCVQGRAGTWNPTLPPPPLLRGVALSLRVLFPSSVGALELDWATSTLRH